MAVSANQVDQISDQTLMVSTYHVDVEATSHQNVNFFPSPYQEVVSYRLHNQVEVYSCAEVNPVSSYLEVEVSYSTYLVEVVF